MNGLLKGILATVLIIAMGLTGTWYWLHAQRPDRSERTLEISAGVVLRVKVQNSPRPLMVHVLTVKLEAIDEIVVTPPDPHSERELSAQLTTDFAERNQLDIAVNGSFFEPFHSAGPLDYYPHENDPVDVLGIAISGGERYSDEPGYGLLWWDGVDVHLGTAAPSADARSALAGDRMVLLNGQIPADVVAEDHPDDLHPRTAVGLDRVDGELILVVVDGRQPGYSEGVTRVELGNLMLELGAEDALALDGGGSSTMVLREGENYRAINALYHTRIPMRERPVANHLGFRLKADFQEIQP